MDYNILLVHIKDIKAGDTVVHNNQLKTVCKNNILISSNGTSLFGDLYSLGLKPVIKVLNLKY